MVVIPKENNEVRICVDLSKLNKHIDRSIYPTSTPHDAITNVKQGSIYFSKIDAKHGYWQIPIEEKSQAFTTFITPWGRFKFLRAPMGLSSTGDEYSRRAAEATGMFENTETVMDDTLTYDMNLEEHFRRVRAFLLKCREKSITLNKNKFEFAKEELKFVGYVIGKTGIKADPDKIRALSNFPKPKSQTELKSFLGLANQLGNFTKDLSSLSGPLRSLLKAKNIFQWMPEHDASFESIKENLCRTPTLCN